MPRPSRAARLKAFQPCVLISDACEQRAHVLNVSTSGALVHLTHGLTVGARVTLHCGTRRLAAKTIWVRAGRAGLRFDAPVSQPSVEALVNGE